MQKPTETLLKQSIKWFVGGFIISIILTVVFTFKYSDPKKINYLSYPDSFLIPLFQCLRCFGTNICSNKLCCAFTSNISMFLKHNWFITILLLVLMCYWLFKYVRLYLKSFQLLPAKLTNLESLVSFLFGLLVVQSIAIKSMTLVIFSIILLTLVFLLRTLFVINQKTQDDKPITFDLTSSVDSQPLESIAQIDTIKGSATYLNEETRQGLFSKIKSLVNDLYQLILRTDAKHASTTICLNASWGAGKSSTINFVMEKINEEAKGQFIIMKFSPWTFNNQTELINDFFNSIDKILKKEYGTGLGSNAHAYIELITPFIENKSYNAMINVFKRIFNITPHTLNSLKDSLKDKMQNVGKPFIIFIDDIDRKTAKEILPLMQLIASQADLPNIVFVPVMDYKRVQDMIIEGYGKAFENYLQKIIHSTYTLPVFSYDELTAIYFSCLDEATRTKYKDTLEKLFEMYAISALRLQMQYIAGTKSNEEKDYKANHNLYRRFQEQIFPYFYPNQNSFLEYERNNNRLEQHFTHLSGELANGKTTKIAEFSTHIYDLLREHLVTTLIYKLTDNIPKLIEKGFRTLSDRYSIQENLITIFSELNYKREIGNLFETIEKYAQYQGLLISDATKSLKDEDKNELASKSEVREALDLELREFLSSHLTDLKNQNIDLYNGNKRDKAANFIADWAVGGLITPRDVKQLSLAINFLYKTKDPVNEKDLHNVVKNVISHQNFNFINSFYPTSTIND